MIKEIVLNGKNGTYVVEIIEKSDKKTKEKKLIQHRLKESKHFSFYLCHSEKEPKRQLILKIARTVEDNGILDRETYVLQTLRDAAFRVEESYKKVSDGKKELNYQLAFPEVMDSFIVETMGMRRAIILGFDIADDLGELVPILHVRTRDKVRVDPKTSVWILGKLLKILAFTHSEGISVGNLSGGNILIHRDEHYVALFDLSEATIHGDDIVPKEIVREEIDRSAREVIILLCGKTDPKEWPEHEDIKDGLYPQLLQSLSTDGWWDDAKEAHTKFYALVEKLWGREYHRYTTYPLTKEEE